MGRYGDADLIGGTPMKAIVISLCAAALALPCTARAAELDGATADYAACVASADNYMEKDLCTAAEIDRQDALVDQAFHAALGIAEEQQRAPLTASQTTWVAYREAFCGAKGAVSGTGHTEMMAVCMVKLAVERRRALEGFDIP